MAKKDFSSRFFGGMANDDGAIVIGEAPAKKETPVKEKKEKPVPVKKEEAPVKAVKETPVKREEPVKRTALQKSVVQSRYYIDTRDIEKRDKRVQLVFPTSLYTLMKEKAKSEGLSMNEYIIRLVADDIEGR